MSASPAILGFDIGGTKCAVVLGRIVNGAAPEILAREVFPTVQENGARAVIGRLCELAHRMLNEQKIKVSEVCAAGVSCGGPLNSRLGLVQSPPNLPGWDDIPVTALIEERLGIPAKLQNDANAGALVEWHWGAARGTQTAIFLTFGTGLGAGLIINGHLHAGQNDLAGELGHWRLAPEGPVGFGKVGSFEGFCSGGGLWQLAGQYHASTTDVRALAEAARNGDAVARRIFSISGQKLGEGLALVVDLLNPEIIVLGSIFVRCEDLIRPAMEAALHNEAIPAAVEHCRILPAQLDEQIGDYAALAVAMNVA